MAFSYTPETGDGATVTFAFSFDYIRESEIHVYVDDVEVFNFTLSGTSQITFAVAPDDQATILIRRIMPDETTYTNFTRGNNFGQDNMNNSFLQTLYLMQETLDGFKPSGYYEKQDIDFGGFTGINLKDPTEDQEIATRLWTLEMISDSDATGSASAQLRLDLASEEDGYGVDLVGRAASFAPEGIVQITVTVGALGDFTNINDALGYLTNFRPRNTNSKVSATLNLLTGFTMEEQVFVNGFDLSFITITSDDAVVPISRLALTEPVPTWGEDHLPAFYGNNGAYLPNIDVLFYMDTSDVRTLKTGLILKTGSHCTFLSGSGITDTGYMGVILVASHLHASVTSSETGVDFSRCNNRAILALSGSSANFEYGKADNCGWSAFQIINSYGNCRAASLLNSGHYGVRSRDGANIAAEGSNTSGATEIGFYASFNSNIQANNCIANNCGEYGANASAGSTLAFASGIANDAGIDGIRALGGSIVYAISAEATGAAGYGLTAVDGSRISARSGEFDGTLGDVHVSGGSLIDVQIATYTTIKAGLTNATINEYTGYGCIQDSGVPVSGALILEIADAPTGGNVSSKTLSGFYTKIGKKVDYSVGGFNIPTTGMTAGNSLYLRGLPFTSFSTVGTPGSIVSEQVIFTGAFITPVVSASTSYITLVNSVSGGNDSTLTVAALNDGIADLTISGFYFTD